ncbi:MAG: T9SS type A sorting domain-containing protein, partial [Cyclobacteriaceae bacterium]|nr:T9SS type A sorting domain-containing protein [Cyclobacteriaceae bacterium]
GDKIDNNLFNVYPNPTDGLLFLDLKEGHSYEYFQINDVFGQIILQKNISNNHQVQFDISNLVAGLYFIGLFSEDIKVVSKFIKQ